MDLWDIGVSVVLLRWCGDGLLFCGDQHGSKTADVNYIKHLIL